MNKNKLVLKHCPNFYKIVNFEYLEDDRISEKLINIYKDYIFDINLDNTRDVELIEKIDVVLNKYIDDYYFRKEMQRDLLKIRVKASDNFLRGIVEGIVTAFETYEQGYTRNIYFARWI